MSSEQVLAALEGELGTGALQESRGTGDAFEVEPADGAALAAALRVLGETGGRARIRGWGTHDALGNLAGAVDVVVSTRGLQGIEELDTQDGVVRVRAGTTLAELAEAAAPHGWELPLGGAASSSVGGALATAAIGPRRLGEGPPRDCVLGLDVVLANGLRTTCGGRVVKNVTGFDLAKLYTGSFGCLGVIESAWLRLRPRPEAAEVRIAALRPGGDPMHTALEVARRGTARCVALLDVSVAQRSGLAPDATPPPTPTPIGVVEFAGTEPGVRRDVAWLAERCDVSEPAAGAVEAVARAQRDTPLAGLRARLAVLPSGCGRLARDLLAAGAQRIVHPGLGLVYAELTASAGAVAAVERIAREARGEARFEVLPDELKRGREVFGVGTDRHAVVERMRALKHQFDPAGVLNPGRFLGGL